MIRVTDVGERLQQIRKLNGWSQRELARRANVTNSAISQMEQGRVSPSVASLKKVLDGVPISLEDFFGLDLESSTNAFYRACDMPDIGDGVYVSKLVGADKTKRALSLMWQFYPAGSDSGEELIKSPEEYTGVVFDGELEITVGAETKTLAPGDGFYVAVGRGFRIRNSGSVGCIAAIAKTENRNK
nr:helix-turn-helix domain-containing protein [Sessilibacter corallicola]